MTGCLLEAGDDGVLEKFAASLLVILVVVVVVVESGAIEDCVWFD